MKRRRVTSSDLSDGEVPPSADNSDGDEDGGRSLQSRLAAAEEMNSSLQNKLERCELDLENSQKYAASLREHSELLTDKIHQHREALTAARNALATATAQCPCPHAKSCERYSPQDSSTAAQSTPAPGNASAGANNAPPAGQPNIRTVSDPSSLPSAPLAIEANTAAMLATAAEEGMRQGGFVYDSRSGMYYDFTSEYYYDSTSRLYYDNNAGIFYSRNSLSGEFELHHQVDLSTVGAPTQTSGNGDSGGPSDAHPTQDHLADGGNSAHDTDVDGDDSPPPAPCVRAIVLASEKLRVGSLFLVTCDGGTVGRDQGLGHVIRIPELVVSKIHAKIEYDSEERSYCITDYGSRNGTFVNEERLSESQVRSESRCLQHGDQVQVGLHTRLLFHIHPAGETCGSCEPGQVQAWLAAKPSEGDSGVAPPASHKQTLNRLKSMYCLGGRRCCLPKNMTVGGCSAEYHHHRRDIVVKPHQRADVGEDGGVPPPADGFKDRAAARRSAVGVDDPDYASLPDPSASSVNRPISSDNKGRKLLEKLGWQDGEGLGQSQGGLSAPINVQSQGTQRSGIGFATAQSPNSTTGSNKWKKAQARYRAAKQSEHEPVDMFA